MYNRKRNRDEEFSQSYSKSKRRCDNSEKSILSGCSNTKTPLNIIETRRLLDTMLEDHFSENIPLQLLDPQVRFKNFLNHDKDQDSGTVKAVLKVIMKASQNKMMEKTFRELLTMILETNFAVKRLDKTISIDLIINFDEEMLKLVIGFLKLNFEIIPGIAYDIFYNRIYNLSALIDSLQIKTNLIDSIIISEIEELKELSKASSVPKPRKVFGRRSNFCNNLEPPDNYRNISIFPTSKDLINIKSKEVFLRENKFKGAYKSVDHYLDVQFRLMREDFIQPLREGLNVFKNNDNKKRFNIRIYKHVYLMYSLPAGKLGIIHNMRFDKSRFKRVNWVQSKQFMYGSLLCFCTDDFETLLFATIVHREVEDLKNGILSVKFHDSVPNENVEYTLFETMNMFESYRHVLLKLQETNEENMCMKKYLVYAENNIDPPNYLSRNIDMEYTFKDKLICPGDPLFNWPQAVELGMDESQFEAFKSTLTKEISIIQGPPGTGKTYIGLNICECLIKNVQNKLPGFGPILVVCYTNHALDQFLEGISNFTNEIIRIGSRCKSDKIREFSIVNCKRKHPINEYSNQAFHLGQRLLKVKKKLIDQEAALTHSKEKYISLNLLKSFISDDHYDVLQSIGLRNWLSGETFVNDIIYKYEVDSIVEWLIYREIRCKLRQIVIDAEEEYLEELEESYYDDMDNEVNYINTQRTLDIDEENIGSLNDEFRQALISFEEYEEASNRWEYATTKNIFEHRLRSDEKLSEEEFNERVSLEYLSLDERWKLYRYWRWKYTDNLYLKSEALEKDYEFYSNQLNEISYEEDRQIMESKSIIGMTTTGAARYSKVLFNIRCKIIIVEEAAEVLESHIVGSLNPGCEHLILIGDHKQLKPNPAVYELAKAYDLDISLFERLINNNLDYSSLSLQHRMRPDIAEIMSFIYKNLRNHESVLNFPNVPSVGSNLHFFDHQEPEECVENIMSYANRFEAEFIVKFCRHLMKNGVEKSQITILTLYSGQMFLLRKLMDRNIFEGVRVCVVDNFQGEENDIILLSLVRSNESEKIGFLSIENRICVSLSRAKHGLYVFGNFQVLSNKNEKWKEICQFLKTKEMLSDSLLLFCENHPEKKMIVKKPNDFNNYPEGGCIEICNQRLKCGHACRKSCHFLDRAHENIVCMEQCTKSCINGHRCIQKCWETCKECNTRIEKAIPGCDHTQVMACGRIPLRRDCSNKCERILPCGHKCTKLCKDTCEPCLIMVDKVSPDCNHTDQYPCFDKNIICKKACDATLGCEHKCSGSCGKCFMNRLHITCQNDCKAQLICGHVCRSKCSRYCPPCPRRCEEGCIHNSCPKECGDECVLCYEKCEWKCRHKRCNRLCHELCDREVCNKFCESFVICQKCHCRFLCFGVCGEKCWDICFNCDPEVLEIFFGTEDEKNAMFITLWTCGHSFEVNSMDTYMNSVAEDGEIITKKCPKCNTIINKRSCYRYINIVKKISLDIKKVQKKMSCNTEDNSEYDKRLVSCSVKISKIFQMYDMKNYFTNKERLRKFEVSISRTSLDLICQVYERCFAGWKVISSDYIDRCIHNLIIWLNPKYRKFNDFEIGQYNVEFDRIDMLLNVHEGQMETDVPLKEISEFTEELKKIIFSAETAEDFRSRWKTFKTSMNLPNMDITENERKQIVKAIGLDKGRWFKCPKGHYYVIGECGGANQISKCAECQSSIGGTDHRLLGDNQFAPEMDESDKPAWPGMDNTPN